MKHFVLMKFKKDYFCDSIKREIERAYEQIHKELPEDIISYAVRESCLESQHGMDLMIELTLAGESSLGRYLTHSAHIDISSRMNPEIIERCSFDYDD